MESKHSKIEKQVSEKENQLKTLDDKLAEVQGDIDSKRFELSYLNSNMQRSSQQKLSLNINQNQVSLTWICILNY